MGFLSFDEKAWDKIRPFSVKKTGVSEAIRAVEAAVPKALSDVVTEAACTTATERLDTLGEKIAGAKGRLDAKKHDAEIKKLVAWASEVTTRRKAVVVRATELRTGYEHAIQEANKAVTPYFDRAEEVVETVHEFVTTMQDKAKQALVAGARGDTETLLKLKEFADISKQNLQEQLQSVKKLHSDATEAAMAKWPKYDHLNPGQQRGYMATYDRVTSIKYKVENLSDSLKPFAEAYEMIVMANTKSEGMRDKFVKLVEADAAACGKVATALGVTESNLDQGIQRATEFIDSAEKEGVRPEDKLEMLGAAAKTIKEAIGNFKRLQTLNDQLAKVLKAKRAMYPELVNADDKEFKPLLERMDKMRVYSEDVSKNLAPKHSRDLKSLGERMAVLRQN